MVVGIVRITVQLPGCHSLKEKRSVLLRMKQRVKHAFDVSLVEVEDMDLWQSTQLGFAVVTQHQSLAHSVVEKILSLLGNLGIATMLRSEKDFLIYGTAFFGEHL